MDRTEAQRQLDDYTQQRHRLQRHYLRPVMLFFALLAFAFPALGGYGTVAGTFALTALLIGWVFYAARLNGVSWQGGQRARLYLTLFVGFVWIVACNAYFVNWNPHDLTLNGLLGGVAAALPFLVLAFTYRP